MSWLRETARRNRMGVWASRHDNDCLMVFVDGNAGTRKGYSAHALEPWEARQFALALNAAAEAIDPGGSADAPALQAHEARGKIAG